MTSLRTPELSSLLLAAAAAALAGCGGTATTAQEGEARNDITPRNGPTTLNPVDPETGEMEITPETRPSPPTPEETTPTGEKTDPEVSADECINLGPEIYHYASQAAGLDPNEKVDFIGRVHNYVNKNGLVVADLSESAGTACDSAIDQEACLTELETFPGEPSPSDWDDPKWSEHAFVISDENGPRLISGADDIRSFLGSINTFNEAAVVLALNQKWFINCADIEKRGDSYVATYTDGVCSGEEKQIEGTIHPDGSLTEEVVAILPSSCAAGRLSDDQCLEVSDPLRAKNMGDYWRDICQLETAAVGAFMRLSDELRLHQAPKHLVDGAVRAAAQEVEHAQATYQLAQKWGSCPGPVESRPSPSRTLLEIALENAVEGCTRELFGAAIAHLQASQARDPQMRSTWKKIAKEETEHAQWSLELHAWMKTQLDEAQWCQVEQARIAAQTALAEHREPTPTQELNELAGVPTPTQLDALLTKLAPIFQA